MAGRQVHKPRDDAHIFCAREQLGGERASLLEFVLRLLRTFGLTEFEAELATRPETFVGTLEEWDQAEAALKEALDASPRLPRGRGRGRLPRAQDRRAPLRRDRTALADLDLAGRLPAAAALRPGVHRRRQRSPPPVHDPSGAVRLGRAVHGDRAGALRRRAAPLAGTVQARLVPVADRHLDYAAVVADALRDAGLRVEVDSSAGRVQAKVRDAQLAKVPYTLVLGDRDEQAGAVNVRLLGGSERRAVPLADFVQHLAATVAAKDPASLLPASGPLES